MPKIKNILFEDRKPISQMSYKEISNEYTKLNDDIHKYYGAFIIILGACLIIFTASLCLIN